MKFYLTLALTALTLSAIVLGVVLYGWRYRNNGARPGDPSWGWRELERVDAV